MVARASEAHVVWHTESLVDEATSLHTSSSRNGTEPINLVLDDQQATRSNHTSELMMVGSEGVGLGAEGVEPRGEPDVFADDLAGGLDVLPLGLLRVGDAPAGGTTRARLLGQTQSDTVNERGRDESTLSVARTSSHTNALGVDANARSGLKSIDDAVDTPCPGGESTCTVAGTVQVEELAFSTAVATLLLSNIVVVESDCRDIAWDWETGSTICDDGRERASSAGLLNGDREGNRLSSLSRGDGKRGAREGGRDA